MKTIVHSNPYYAVSKEDYRLTNGTRGVYYGIRGLRTAFIVPFMTETTLVLTYQWRYLLNQSVWEFPAGRVEPDEEPAVAAARELEEEAGVHAGELRHIGWYSPCNGLSDEHTDVFVARHLTKTQQRLDAIEQMSVHEISIDKFEAMIKAGDIHDGMTLAAWQLVKSCV